MSTNDVSKNELTSIETEGQNCRREVYQNLEKLLSTMTKQGGTKRNQRKCRENTKSNVERGDK